MIIFSPFQVGHRMPQPIFHKSRGLLVANTNFEYLDEGGQGVVFLDRARGRILKVYKAQSKHSHYTKVFDGEVSAYRIAADSPELRELVPAFLGEQTIQKIEDKNGVDVTHEFYPDLAFETEFIPGRLERFRWAPQSERDRIVALFHSRGIRYVSSASVLVNAGRIEKLVDLNIGYIEPFPSWPVLLRAFLLWPFNRGWFNRWRPDL